MESLKSDLPAGERCGNDSDDGKIASRYRNLIHDDNLTSVISSDFC